MQKLGAAFIAICMVAIATSAGAVLSLKFAFTIAEAAAVSFGILLTLLLIHYQISRVRDRMILDEQMDDLTRLKLTLTKEVQDVREMAQGLEADVQGRMEREIEPMLAELDIIGSLVRQLAESCAEMDDRVQGNESQLAEVNSKLQAATRSVKEVENLLRDGARLAGSHSMSSKAAEAPSVGEARSKKNSRIETEQDILGLGDTDPKDQVEQPIREEDETAVRRALALGRIEMHMQPIVRLPHRKPVSYEMLTRLLDDQGEVITPDIFLPVCRKNSFLPMLDRLSINEAFRLLGRLIDRGQAIDCFCNLSLRSLADSDFFALLKDQFEENKEVVEHIILEFSQTDFRQFGILEDETLQLLRSMGFRFSVDQVSTLSADFDTLARKGVRSAKIAAPVLMHRDAGRGLDIHPADLSRLLSRKNIDMIVTHVENEATLVGLVDFNVHLAQGNLFAPPKALKNSPDMMSGGGEQGGGANSSGQSSGRTSGRSQVKSAVGRETINQVARSAIEKNNASSRTKGADASPNAPTRTLGENPKVAEALRAMAAKEGASPSRDHFRSVLAEAAGLINNDRNPAARSGTGPAPQRPVTSNSAVTNRLPATDEFGLKTGTDRGQFIDLSEPAPSESPNRNGRERAPTVAPQQFERLIR